MKKKKIIYSKIHVCIYDTARKPTWERVTENSTWTRNGDKSFMDAYTHNILKDAAFVIYNGIRRYIIITYRERFFSLSFLPVFFFLDVTLFDRISLFVEPKTNPKYKNERRGDPVRRRTVYNTRIIHRDACPARHVIVTVVITTSVKARKKKT